MFKNHIYQKRKQLKLTQPKLAKLLGVYRGTVAAHEQGFRLIRKKYIQKYCEILGMNENDLFCDS